MRISDWSSDVCSSYLRLEARAEPLGHCAHATRVETAGIEFRKLHQLVAQRRCLRVDPIQMRGISLSHVGNPICCNDSILREAADWRLRKIPVRALYRSEAHTSELQSLMRL